jgi:antitoxin (DNA-binding transcriptional repressor) of toxin-antitoxin stability system
MVRVTVDQFRHDFAGLIKRVEAGETLLVLGDEEKAIAEVKPMAPPARSLRPAGLCAGEFQVPDDFDQPLPEHVLNEFEGQ